MDNLKADMKETPVSNVEKSFIYEAISKAKRTDGRHLDERRNVEIHFGHEFGSCIGLQNIFKLMTENLYSKTILHKNDQKSKSILKNNVHLMDTF